jgi:hypothetical protein
MITFRLILASYPLPDRPIVEVDLALSFRFIIRELTTVDDLWVYPQFTITLSHAFEKIAIKSAAIFPSIESLTVRKVMFVYALERITVWECFLAETILSKIDKPTFISPFLITKVLLFKVRVPIPWARPNSQAPL